MSFSFFRFFLKPFFVILCHFVLLRCCRNAVEMLLGFHAISVWVIYIYTNTTRKTKVDFFGYGGIRFGSSRSDFLAFRTGLSLQVTYYNSIV